MVVDRLTATNTKEREEGSAPPGRPKHGWKHKLQVGLNLIHY